MSAAPITRSSAMAGGGSKEPWQALACASAPRSQQLGVPESCRKLLRGTLMIDD